MAMLAAVSGSISLRSPVLFWLDWIGFLCKHFMFLLLVWSRSCCSRIQSGRADRSAAYCRIIAGLLSKVCMECDSSLCCFVTCSWWSVLVSRKALNSYVLSCVVLRPSFPSSVALGNLRNRSDLSYFYMRSRIFFSFIAFYDQLLSRVIIGKNQNVSYRKRTGLKTRQRDGVSKHLFKLFCLIASQFCCL